MTIWGFASAIFGGLTISAYISFVTKRDGQKALNSFFWSKMLLYMILVILVIGVGTNKLIHEMETRYMVRSFIWFGLFLLIVWRIKSLPIAPKPN